ncbi:MAG: RbsD/FucU family protein [Mycobacteriales bacterium]
MLNSPLTHPQICAALAGAGHGSLVLIADGNFPASTRCGPHAELVYLNLCPGTIDAVTILRQVLTVTPVEEVMVMAPMKDGPYAVDGQPAIWTEFRSELAAAHVTCALQPVERPDFYDVASGPDVALTIVSGESRIYGNVLLRIGVITTQ